MKEEYLDHKKGTALLNVVKKFGRVIDLCPQTEAHYYRWPTPFSERCEMLTDPKLGQLIGITSAMVRVDRPTKETLEEYELSELKLQNPHWDYDWEFRTYVDKIKYLWKGDKMPDPLENICTILKLRGSCIKLSHGYIDIKDKEKLEMLIAEEGLNCIVTERTLF